MGLFWSIEYGLRNSGIPTYVLGIYLLLSLVKKEASMLLKMLSFTFPKCSANFNWWILKLNAFEEMNSAVISRQIY
jgi:hypothetical protein